jgi:hypothetical protein
MLSRTAFMSCRLPFPYRFRQANHGVSIRSAGLKSHTRFPSINFSSTTSESPGRRLIASQSRFGSVACRFVVKRINVNLNLALLL